MDKYIVTHLQPLWWLRGEKEKEKRRAICHETNNSSNLPQNRNTRKNCKICSKLTIKTQERHH